MDYIWHLIWHSQYGIEEVDSFDTRTEAEAMQVEYSMAYGEGYIEIVRRRG
jgi:hypothetical protein